MYMIWFCLMKITLAFSLSFIMIAGDFKLMFYHHGGMHAFYDLFIGPD